MPATYIGADIAQDKIDVDLAGVAFTVTNDRAGYRQLLRRLAQIATPHVVLEATGGYERGLLQALWDAQVLVTRAQPNLVRDHARGHGQRAKTDRIDAQMLSLYGTKVAPKPTPAPTRAQLELQDISRYRAGLVAEQTRLKLRGHQEHAPFVRRELASHLLELRRRIKRADAALRTLVAQDALWQARIAEMDREIGVAFGTAATLQAEMPELGTLNREQAAALAGLAPFPKDSGKRRGKRQITGGRARVRCALYMSACTAIQHDPQLGAKYHAMVAANKPKKVALVAIMRRLLIRLNNRLKNLPLPA